MRSEVGEGTSVFGSIAAIAVTSFELADKFANPNSQRLFAIYRQYIADSLALIAYISRLEIAEILRTTVIKRPKLYTLYDPLNNVQIFSSKKYRCL